MKTKKPTEVELGTLTLSQRYQSFHDGTIFEIGENHKVSKVMVSPTGIRYYKISGTTHWVTDHQVCNVNINNVPTRRTVKIYSA